MREYSPFATHTKILQTVTNSYINNKSREDFVSAVAVWKALLRA